MKKFVVSSLVAGTLLLTSAMAFAAETKNSVPKPLVKTEMKRASGKTEVKQVAKSTLKSTSQKPAAKVALKKQTVNKLPVKPVGKVEKK